MAVRCDIAVIGTGMAGLAAACFAAERGAATAVIGATAEIIFASGLIDLLGVYPPGKKRVWKNPRAAIRNLVAVDPEHPYARVSSAVVEDAIDTFIAVLKKAGLPYRRRKGANSFVLTPMGTVKPTYAVPLSMWAGPEAFQRQRPALIAGIDGLKGFSARLIAEAMHRKWPALRWTHIPFPESELGEELFAERVARRLESEAVREAFAERLEPHIADARAVGLPAVLGLYRSEAVFADLQRRLGVPVFEIPTMPPSVAGLRIKETLLRVLAEAGVRVFAEQKVHRVRFQKKTGFRLTVGGGADSHTVDSRAVILAAGRFLGGGLHAERKRIREPLFDLPVHQTPDRATWHRDTFLDPMGHPINRAGIQVDENFRPLNRRGKPAYPNLFAAGAILAHQDWMREKSGAGIAISSAYAALNACCGRQARKTSG
jgi:glycerol-3-phosphate dehydrogenase subunit B